MNIFILDDDPAKSVSYYVDKHCVKMLLEYSQILCTAINQNQLLQAETGILAAPYKSTHLYHPCTVWASKNYDNFAYLVALTNILHEEFKYRYKKEHLSYLKLQLAQVLRPSFIDYGLKLSISKLQPAKVVPEDCKTDSVIESYRNYYRRYKTHLFHWTKRPEPYWLNLRLKPTQL